ncbi:MAG: hypothetical protein ACLFTT_02925 [Candidatus Hydrogenedentota bacterium]
MKSAYERAMERLEESSGPGKKLSDAQKAQLAEIDKTYDAKLAQARLDYETKISQAPPPEAQNLQAEMAAELAAIEEKRNREKDSVWEQA